MSTKPDRTCIWNALCSAPISFEQKNFYHIWWKINRINVVHIVNTRFKGECWCRWRSIYFSEIFFNEKKVTSFNGFIIISINTPMSFFWSSAMCMIVWCIKICIHFVCYWYGKSIIARSLNFPFAWNKCCSFETLNIFHVSWWINSWIIEAHKDKSIVIVKCRMCVIWFLYDYKKNHSIIYFKKLICLSCFYWLWQNLTRSFSTTKKFVLCTWIMNKLLL